MPNEFAALEKVTGKVSGIAGKVKQWSENLKWDAPSQFGEQNPFKGTKNLKVLNQKYTEILKTTHENNRPQLNVYYLEQRILIIENFVKMLNLIKQDYLKVKAKKAELKITDAEPDERLSGKEFFEKYVNAEGKVDPKKPQQTQQQTTQPTQNQSTAESAEVKSVRDYEKELNSDLKTLLTEFGVYKEYAMNDVYLKNKVDFITRLSTGLKISLNNQRTKLDKYKEEVRTNKRFPKKQKEQKPETETVKTKDSYLTADNRKIIKVKIKK